MLIGGKLKNLIKSKIEVIRMTPSIEKLVGCLYLEEAGVALTFSPLKLIRILTS